MIKKTYSVVYKLSPFKSKLKSVKETSSADLYLNKLQGWFNLEVSTNPNINIDYQPKIYETKIFKNKVVYKVNSLNFELTDIEIEDVPYRYIIKTSKEVGLFDIKFNLQINDVVFYNNNFYTNTKAYYYGSETDYLFTENVLDINNCKILYKSDHIEVQTPPNTKLIFKENILQADILNEYLTYIPSFYIKINEKQIRCIESNVEMFNIKTSEINNYLNFKVNTASPLISKSLNMSFSTGTTDVLNSSHCFPLHADIEYFNISDEGSITLGNKDDYIFKISKILNPDKVKIIFNNYLKENIDIDKKNLMQGVINSYKELNNNINHINNLYLQTTSVSKEYIYLKVFDGRPKNIFMNTYNFTKPVNEKIKKGNFTDYSYNSKYAPHLYFKTFSSEGFFNKTFDNINYKELDMSGGYNAD